MAKAWNLAPPEVLDSLLDAAAEVSRMLRAMITSLRNKENSDKPVR